MYYRCFYMFVVFLCVVNLLNLQLVKEEPLTSISTENLISRAVSVHSSMQRGAATCHKETTVFRLG